jgi:hypothetical protein
MIFVVNSRTSYVDCTWHQLHDGFCKEQNGLWFHESGRAIPLCMLVSRPISGENMSVHTLGKLWKHYFVWKMLRLFVLMHGETISTPGRIEKENKCSISIRISRHKLSKCVIAMDLCGYTHCAIDSVVQRDWGVTTFHQEWIQSYLLQYTLMVSTHNDELRHIHWLHVLKANICGSEVYKHLFRAKVITEEIPTRELGKFPCTTRYIAYLIVLECALFTYAVRLSNLENSNVRTRKLSVARRQLLG